MISSVSTLQSIQVIKGWLITPLHKNMNKTFKLVATKPVDNLIIQALQWREESIIDMRIKYKDKTLGIFTLSQVEKNKEMTIDDLILCFEDFILKVVIPGQVEDMRVKTGGRLHS